MYENDGGLLSPRDAYRLMLKDYPDVMDIGQMCEALGVSTKTGYKLLKDGKIEYLKIGRAYRMVNKKFIFSWYIQQSIFFAAENITFFVC